MGYPMESPPTGGRWPFVLPYSLLWAPSFSFAFALPVVGSFSLTHPFPSIPPCGRALPVGCVRGWRRSPLWVVGVGGWGVWLSCGCLVSWWVVSYAQGVGSVLSGCPQGMVSSLCGVGSGEVVGGFLVLCGCMSWGGVRYWCSGCLCVCRTYVLYIRIWGFVCSLLGVGWFLGVWGTGFRGI